MCCDKMTIYMHINVWKINITRCGGQGYALKENWNFELIEAYESISFMAYSSLKLVSLQNGSSV